MVVNIDSVSRGVKPCINSLRQNFLNKSIVFCSGSENHVQKNDLRKVWGGGLLNKYDKDVCQNC